MHVLVTADAVGGVWTYSLDLARSLRARGDKVVLAALGPSPSAAQHRAARDADVELVDTGLPLEWLAADEVELRRAASGLVNLARVRGVQLVHLSSPALAGAVRFPMTVVGVAHSCLATWWAALRDGLPPPDFAWRIAATARGYAACDALIAPSLAFAAATQQAYGIRPTPIHNGRSPAASAAAMRDIPVATTGRLWDAGKDAATLDAVAGLLDAPVLALGAVHGPQGQRARLNRLRLAGPKPASWVAKILARTRIFVSTARYEPFGLAVLEAAQAGCALVLSDIASFRELWDGAAVFVMPGDAAGFAAALTMLLHDDREAARLGAAARMRARRYGLDRCVEATRAVHHLALRPAGAAEVAA